MQSIWIYPWGEEPLSEQEEQTVRLQDSRPAQRSTTMAGAMDQCQTLCNFLLALVTLPFKLTRCVLRYLRWFCICCYRRGKCRGLMTKDERDLNRAEEGRFLPFCRCAWADPVSP
mmetsp:Transcript_17682/g.54114  ORF Transcript_17682/g.54114 Transcript_17682/m.54114 type:complete len:115 (-) Transcript_17682:428-772(-)